MTTVSNIVIQSGLAVGPKGEPGATDYTELTNVPTTFPPGEQYAGFDTRGEFLTWIATGVTVENGTVVGAGGVQYVYSTGARDISDMDDWLPFGPVYPDHFADNAVFGTTDMSAAVIAAASYAKNVHLRGVIYRFAFTTTTGLTPQAAARFIGEKGAEIQFVPHDNSYRNLITASAGDLYMEGIKLSMVGQTGQTVAFFNVAASVMKFRRMEFDGSITDDGATASHIAYLWSYPETGTQDNLDVEDCEIHRFTRGLLKTNTSTSSQTGMRFVNNRMHDCYVSTLTLNSPLGVCKKVEMRGNRFYMDGTVDPTIYVGTTTAFIAFASVHDFSVVDNDFEASADMEEAIHIEEDCQNFVISNNRINVYFEGISVQDNNVVGSPVSPSGGLIHTNKITMIGTSKAAGSRGITFVFDATAAPPAEKTICESNVITDFEYGIVSDCELGDAVVIKNNLISVASIGIYDTYMSQIQGNTTQLCDTDIRSDVSGYVEDHTFIDPTNLVNPTGRVVTVINPRFKWTPKAIGTGTTQSYVISPVASGDRLWGYLTYNCWDTSTTSNQVQESMEVDWDGTTLTVGADKYSIAGGAISAAPSVNSGDFRVGVFCASAVTVAVSASLNGSMVFA